MLYKIINGELFGIFIFVLDDNPPCRFIRQPVIVSGYDFFCNLQCAQRIHIYTAPKNTLEHKHISIIGIVYPVFNCFSGQILFN